MELILSLKKIDLLEKVENKVAGIIYGSAFSLKYDYSFDELVKINEYSKAHGLKSYISIDALICEDELEELEEYIISLKELDIAGIYFADLAVISLVKKHELSARLIYDPNTLMTNVLDIGFYLDEDIDVVLSRELTLEEIASLVEKYPYRIDMQIFGHMRMSYSKRKFVSNYLKEINVEKDIDNKDSLTLIEESRSYKLPIKENNYGTVIYTDYVFNAPEELIYIMPIIKRGIIETEFLNDELVLDAVNGLSALDKENYRAFDTSIRRKHADKIFTKAFLYQKTTDKKEDE